jgi:RNA polymerase sigma factor (sigma-70 family)
MNWERIEKWEYVVTAVAADYHKKFPMVELEDVKQSLYEWFAKHPNKLDEWESIGEKDAKNLIYRSLRNQALDYCQYWKSKTLGYEVSDLYYYDADVVEALLPSVIRGEMTITHKLNLGRPGRPSAPSEGGNLMVMLIEIEDAYLNLDMDDTMLLFYRYGDGMDFDEIAKMYEDVSTDAIRMRHKRIIKKLIKKIGGSRPYKDNDLDRSDDGEVSLEYPQ